MSEPWFSMVGDEIKPEEYRSIKAYYLSKLYGKKARKLFDSVLNDVFANDYVRLKYAIKAVTENYTPIEYTHIKFTNGYGNHRPSYLAEFKGIKIDYGREEWGAEPDKKYFVISLGEISERFKC